MRNEKGNVFIYLLIAIALFAALGYTISKNTKGENTNNMTRRQMDIATSDIIDYSQKLRRAVNNLRNKGCSENDIDFSNATISDYGHTPAAPVKCQIFGSSGGKMSFQRPAPAWLDSSQSAETGYNEWVLTSDLIIDGVGTASPDLVLLLPYVKKDLCVQINTLTDITAASTNTPPESTGGGFAFDKFIGAYGGTYTVTDTDNYLDTHTDGCFNRDGEGGTYYFYSVMVER